MPEQTVGQLLHAAEREAVHLLNRVDASDALALAAGWGSVLEGAAEVLAALPVPVVGDNPPTTDQQYLALRVAEMAAQVSRLRPVAATPDPGMVSIADTFRQVATLVRRHAHDGMTRTEEGRIDLEAARVRIARTIATGAHAASRELQGFARTVQAQDRASKGPIPPRALSLPSTATWVRVAQTHEQVALEYVNGHRSEARPGPAGAPSSPSPLGVQLATWSTIVIRGAADPRVSSTSLRQIAAGQAWILRAATALTAAAADLHQIDPSTAPHLIRRLGTAAERWSAVADDWSWAQTPDRPTPSPTVLASSSAAVAAVNGVLRAGNGWATPAQIAASLNGATVPRLLRTITETSQVLADSYEQLPHELHAAGRLRAPAATLATLAQDYYDEHLRSRWQREDDPSPEVLPINLADVAANRLLPLTATARAALHRNAGELATAAQAAHAAVLVNGPIARGRSDPPSASTSDPATARLPAQPAADPRPRSHPGPGITR